MTTVNASGVGLKGSTGTGTFVGSTSATLVTPVLGTPTSGNLSNCTAYPATALTGQVPVANGGTGAATLTGVLVGNGVSNFTAINAVNNAGLLTNGSGTASWVAYTGTGSPVLSDSPNMTGTITMDSNPNITMNAGSQSGNYTYITMNQTNANNGSGSGIDMSVGTSGTNLQGVKIWSRYSNTVSSFNIDVYPGSTVTTPTTAFRINTPTIGTSVFYTTIIGSLSVTGTAGGTEPNASTIIDISAATTKGLGMPSQTTTQKNAITAPLTGLTVYDSTLGDLAFYNGASWISPAITFNGNSGSASGSAITISGGSTGLTTSGSSSTLSLTGTLAKTNGGTGVTSVTTSPTASEFAGWDTNSNFSADNFIEGYATTATSAATTTLTVDSVGLQYFTGSTTQTVKLPVTSTLVLGQQYNITNNSSGVVTVQSSGSNTIQAMAQNTKLIVTCISTSGTGIASWDAHYTTETGEGTVTSVAMTVPSILSISGSPITTSGTLALSYSGTALPVANGGTGAPTLTGVLTGNGSSAVTANAITQHDVLVGGASNAITSISPSTSGFVLTSNGTSADPTFQAVSASGAITTIAGNTGSATPSSGTLTINGGSTGLTTSGTSSTLSLTGTLALANGGTNASLTASNGGIFYSTANAGAVLSGTATSSQVLLSGSSAAPTWSTTTYPSTVTANNILYGSSSNVIGSISSVNSAGLLTNGSGVPAWVAYTGTGSPVLSASPSMTGTIAMTSNPAITLNAGSQSGNYTSITMNQTNANNGSGEGFTMTVGTSGTNLQGANVWTRWSNTISSWNVDIFPGSTVTTSTTAFRIITPTIGTAVFQTWIIGSLSVSSTAGGSAVNASAIIDISGTTTKGLGLPVLTTTQKNAITSPLTGLTVYDTTLDDLAFYDGAAWVSPAITFNGDSASAAGSIITISGGSTGLTTSGSGSTITFAGTLAVANGGTGVTSATSAPTASAFSGWDANKNLSADNFIYGYTTVATAAGTVSLTVDSTGLLYLTGTSTETVALPTTSLIVTGQTYKIFNNSTGLVTVQSSGGNTLQIMEASTYLVATCISTSGTGTASWSWYYASQSAFTKSDASLNTFLGTSALGSLAAGGTNNTGIGYQALTGVTTGDNNVAIGKSAGSAYTSAEANNICIGSSVNGTASENNTLRIGSGTGNTGTAGNLAKSFICGIYGVTTTSSTTSTCIISDGNQLGTISSSARYKDNIKPIESNFIHDLNCVQFNYKAHNPSDISYGLIAEEVLKVSPNLVNLDSEGKPESVKYHLFDALLLNEIQKLRKELDELKNKLH